MNTTRRCALGLALLGAAAGAWALGGDALPAPDLLRPRTLPGWAATLGPEGIAMSLLRLAVVLGSGWLGALTLAGVALDAIGSGGRASEAVRRYLHALTPEVARHALSGALGVTLATGLGATATAAATPAAAAGSSVAMTEPGPAPADPTTPTPPRSHAVATMRALADGEEPGTGSEEASARDEVVEALAVTGEPQDTWVVEPGDSFWSIAAEVLGDEALGDEALGDAGAEPLTERAIARYWRVLIDANRDRLVTGDPDLLYPGQELLLPPR
jgi:nucleoid-associated protein YgaU